MAKETRREVEIQHDIRRALAQHVSARMFRFHSGRFWQGSVIEHSGEFLTLANPRAINVGFEGLSDLDGWVTRRITPAMVGTEIAQFAALEVKKMNEQPSGAQTAFISQVQRMGGLAGVARSAEDALRILLLG